MRLTDFIDSNLIIILREWEAFVTTQLSSSANMEVVALRNHAPLILLAIAKDLRQLQSTSPSSAWSTRNTNSMQDGSHNTAKLDVELLAQDRLSISQLLSEYNALRATVMRLWLEINDSLSKDVVFEDLTRFNEVLDQVIVQCVDLFNKKSSHDLVSRDAVDKELMLNRGRLEYASRLSNVGFWYCNLPFEVLEWDERVKEHFFIEPSATVTIEDFYDRIHPDDRERTRSAIDASISSREAYDIIYRTKHPLTGEVKWIRALGGTDYAPDGSPIHFDGITVDVTAQKMADLRVAESEARHRGVITNMDEAFALFDPQFNIIEANDAACQLTCIDRSKLIGSNHWEQFPGTYDSEIGQMYKQVLLDGQPRFLEHLYEFPDGRKVWFEARAFKVGAGVAVLFRDVSERVSMIEALKDADKRKNEFLALLAHELRNPLAPILNSLSIMKLKGHDASTVEKKTLVIERQVSQMVRLIDDLMDISRISHGKLELKRAETSISDVINSAVESSRPSLDAVGITLIVNLPDEPILLNADATRLTQVFLNLLNNAAKFTNQGGQVQINTALETDDANAEQKILVSVVDTGIGIKPEDQSKVFEGFTQLPNSMKRSHGGLGIGLMLVKRIVELHGGRVNVHSEGLGQGTTFTVELPVLSNSSLIKPQIQKQDQPSVVFNKLRVLVVDDNKDAAISLASYFDILGHKSLVVHDGASAIEVAEHYQPNVIFLDIGMPGMDGHEVTAYIRKQSWGKTIKVIAITGWGQEQDRVKSAESGFDAHFVKPVDLELLSNFLSES